MQIVSRYASVCRLCGAPIPAATKVEWSKGVGTQHVSCGSARATPRAATPKRRAPRRQMPAATAPELVVQRRGTGRGDAGHPAGTVIYLAREGAGGGPDGHYWTVLASGSTPPCEDLDQFDWHVWHHVRPSSETEATALLASREKKAEREAHAAARTTALAALVADLRATGVKTPEVDVRRPEGTVIAVEPRSSYGREVALVVSTDGAMVSWYACSGSDDYRLSRVDSADAALVARARALAITGGVA